MEAIIDMQAIGLDEFLPADVNGLRIGPCRI
jgi:hypothetical protein